MESATIITPAPMSLEDAKTIVGIKNPGDMLNLSKEYACKIWATIENKEWTEDVQKKISTAYRRIAESICEAEITETGKFHPQSDFSILSDVEVFPGRQGVVTCSACNGLGERIKFNKKPAEVQCLKCKTVEYTLDGELIQINENVILVNGEDKSTDQKYMWLLGRVIEDCLSCGGTGRYIKEPSKDLRINVECKTCRGRKYTDGAEKTQVLTKCKTCKGKRKLKIPKLTGSVKSTTECKICKGMGFQKAPIGPDNPVISKDLAEKIKSL